MRFMRTEQLYLLKQMKKESSEEAADEDSYQPVGESGYDDEELDSSMLSIEAEEDKADDVNDSEEDSTESEDY